MVRILLGSRLARLAADLLAYVPNALALVWLRRAHRAQLGGNLTHQLLVGSLDLDHGVVVNRDLDPLGSLVLYGMGVAHDQVHAIGLGLGLVTDALDLQALGEPLGNALDHVLHQGPGQPVQCLVPLFLAGPGHSELVFGKRQLHVRVQRAAELATGPLHGHSISLDLEGDTLRHRHRLPSDSRHSSSYHTTASSSPPRFALRASRSVMRPRGVDTMAMPSPFLTRGSSRHLT